jgi:mono/diheme cytochrome c family protein
LTEIPEHLLQRSRERRAALGLEGGEVGATTPAAPTPASAAAPAAAVEEAPAAAAPAVVEPEVPAYVAPPEPPKRIPVWMTPVLLLLPVWAFIYLGTFGERGGGEELTPLQLGERVYSANCASCHGANGEGSAVFPRLAGGEAVKTFPDEPEHTAWVENGSQGVKGQPYGDPAREGGQRVATQGAMPGFASTLSAEEIAAVVLYEREGL